MSRLNYKLNCSSYSVVFDAQFVQLFGTFLEDAQNCRRILNVIFVGSFSIRKYLWIL